MTTLRALSIRIGDLFDLFDESIKYVSDEDKSEVLGRFSVALTTKHGVNKEEIDAGIRMLSTKEAARKGLLGPNGTRREIVATRTVPVSQPEERDQKNGLMWRDVPSTDEHSRMWADALHR
jgi:hypothetical protein